MKDHYSTLGVARSAAHTDIKQAYRRLASQHHPDKGGDTARFQEIEQAYRVLCDPVARQEYDNPPAARMHARPAGFDFNTIFDMFGTRFGDTSGKPGLARIQLWIGLADVITGGPRTIAVSSPAGQQNLEITIPVGVEDGAAVRYPRMAPGGFDLVINFRVRAEPGWQRQDQHIIRDIVVDAWDMVLGTDLELQTLEQRTIVLGVPPGSQPGTMLRVRAHGVPDRNSVQRGDLFVRLAARFPEQISPELLEHIRRERGH